MTQIVAPYLGIVEVNPQGAVFSSPPASRVSEVQILDDLIAARGPEQLWGESAHPDNCTAEELVTLLAAQIFERLLDTDNAVLQARGRAALAAGPYTGVQLAVCLEPFLPERYFSDVTVVAVRNGEGGWRGDQADPLSAEAHAELLAEELMDLQARQADLSLARASG